MTTLQIRLLGHFSITYQDAPLPAFTRTRLQAFVAYLLLHCQTPQPRQHVAFQLWPDSTEAQAHSNLRKAIHQLRRALPACDDFLQIDTRTVHWRPQVACTIDIDEFVARRQAADQSGATDPARQQALLAEAVAFYQGDLLPGCYDEWLIPERERLRQQLIETLERLVWVSEDRRDYATAIHHANHLLRVEPLAESTYQQLMRLHALTGDRAAALQVYHTCVTVLQREVGVAPGDAIQAAHTQLLAAAIPAGLRPTPTSVGAIRLVGRQTEWRHLRALWQQTVQGQTNFCLLQGEAGIGKTRLAEEIRDWVARQGIITATTRSYAAEGALAYAPVVEWLRSPPLQTALATLAEPWLTEVARLLPELLVERPTLPRPAPLTDQWQRQRLFEALARAFTSDGQAKLLIIDDLQWCDSETLAWLRYLRRFARSNHRQPHHPAPLLLVGTARREEINDAHPLTAFLLDLRRNDEVTELTLTPLNAAETAELTAQLTTTPLTAEAAQTVYSQSEGSPLFVVEMVRSGMAAWRLDGGDPVRGAHSLPPKVHAVIQQRLTQLSPAARQLLGLAATIGRSFSFALLQQAGSHPEEELVQYLDELWQRGLVREQELHTYDFSHDRIREAAYVLVSPVQRPLWHKRVAQALEMLYAADLDPVSARLAAHYEQAGNFALAVGYYQRAGEIAARRFDHTNAIILLNAGLRLLKFQPQQTTADELELVMLLAKAGSLVVIKGFSAAEIAAVYAQIETLLPRIDDNSLIFQVFQRLRGFYGSVGKMEQAQQYTNQLLALTSELGDPVYQFGACQASGVVNLQLGHFSLARHYLEQGENLYQGQLVNAAPFVLGDVVAIYSNLSLTLWLLGYPDQARKKIAKAIRLAEQLDNRLQSQIALFFASLIYRYMCATELAASVAKRMVLLHTEYSIAVSKAGGLALQGWIQAHQGNLAEGAAQMSAGIDEYKAMNLLSFITHLFQWLVEAQMEVQNFDRVEETLDEAFTMSGQYGQRSADAELYRLRGEWLLQSAGGEPEPAVQAAAESAFQQALTIARTQAAKSFELRAAMSLCRLWQQQGKRAEAYNLLAAIYGWFTEGFDTPDLQEAKALLAALR